MLNPQKLADFRVVCSNFFPVLLKLRVSINSVSVNNYSTALCYIKRTKLASSKNCRLNRNSCPAFNLRIPRSSCIPTILQFRAESTSVNSTTEFKSQLKYPKLPVGHLKTMKLENKNFKSLFTPEFKTLYELFTKYGYELRLAGGPVRDLLAGITPADLDFASTATPDEMKAMFEKEGVRMINAKGEKHGTITARINDKVNYEITTLRIDVSTDGRHAEVEFTKNWELDSGRRDLTINSMFLDYDGTVYDYFNGAEDLANKRVRFVGKPSDRIQEDYLRILRYFRFYGRIAPTPRDHESSTLEAIRNNMSGLQRISGERIWVELKKILTGNHAGELMLTMMELGIGEFIGLPHDANLEQFKLLMERVKESQLEINPITALCAFLNNDDDGKALHARLKLSAFERDLCYFVIEHRGRKSQGDGNSLRAYQYILLLNNQITRSLLPIYIQEVLKYDGNLEILKEFQEWDPPKFPINGHKLMERNIGSGKIMTLLMTKLKERWIQSNFQLSEDELFKLLPEVKGEIDLVLPPNISKGSKKRKV